ncbi:hypothetical protein [Streptomyces sp. NPDC059611]|uniref:hypothetical protein n=1 Tax=Streptomyces sp. NPDC059611 TaxID=3346884 RepID=UPI00367741B7
MEHLIAAADVRGVPITLSPSDKLGGDVARLHAFYRRLGFFDNIARGKLNAGRASMVRVPGNFAATAQLPPGSVSCCSRA